MNPANNPANFVPALGRPAVPGMVRPPGTDGTQQPGIMALIAQLFQNQGPFTGWRAEVMVKERCVKVYQLYVLR